MSEFYDKEGNPIDMLTWGKLCEDKEYKIIQQETLPDGKWVSTVWLGLNHSFDDNATPLIYETMIFPKKGNWGEIDCERYSTLAEAKKGHKKMIEKYS